MFAFYLAFVAELPPPPPKPLKPKSETGSTPSAQGRRGGRRVEAEDIEESATGGDETDLRRGDRAVEAEEPTESEVPARTGSLPRSRAEKTEDDAPADENTSDEETKPAEDTSEESTGLNTPTVGCEIRRLSGRSPCVGAGGYAAVSPSRTSLASTWEQLIATM